MPVEPTFGATLRNARTQAGLTTIQLGARLGVSANVITYWEKGSRVPDADRQAEILAALDAPSRALADLIAELQRDINERIARFAVDAHTLERSAAPHAPRPGEKP